MSSRLSYTRSLKERVISLASHQHDSDEGALASAWKPSPWQLTSWHSPLRTLRSRKRQDGAQHFKFVRAHLRSHASLFKEHVPLLRCQAESFQLAASAGARAPSPSEQCSLLDRCLYVTPGTHFCVLRLVGGMQDEGNDNEAPLMGGEEISIEAELATIMAEDEHEDNAETHGGSDAANVRDPRPFLCCNPADTDEGPETLDVREPRAKRTCVSLEVGPELVRSMFVINRPDFAECVSEPRHNTHVKVVSRLAELMGLMPETFAGPDRHIFGRIALAVEALYRCTAIGTAELVKCFYILQGGFRWRFHDATPYYYQNGGWCQLRGYNICF